HRLNFGSHKQHQVPSPEIPLEDARKGVPAHEKSVSSYDLFCKIPLRGTFRGALWANTTPRNSGVEGYVVGQTSVNTAKSGWRSVRSSESQRSRQGIEEALRCSVSHTGAPKLRQVVAEGSEDHVIDALRGASNFRPSVLGDVSILRAKLQSTLRTIVNAVPEPGRTLQQGTGISIAISRVGRQETAAGNRELSTRRRSRTHIRGAPCVLP